MKKYRIDPTAGAIISLGFVLWAIWETFKHPTRWDALVGTISFLLFGFAYFYFWSYIAIDGKTLKIVRIVPTKRIPIDDIEKIEKRATPTERLVIISYRENGKAKTAKFRYNAYPEKTLKEFAADLKTLNPSINVSKR